MEQLRNAELILRLKNVFKPSGPGTVIYPSGRAPELPLKVSCLKSSTPAPSFMLANGYHGDLQCRRRPTAVTIKESITLINVTCSRNTKSQGFLASVFLQLERNTVAPDLVATSEMSVSLAIQSGDDSKISSRLMSDLQKFGVVSISLNEPQRSSEFCIYQKQVSISENMTIVSVIGHRMRNMVGTASRSSSLVSSSLELTRCWPKDEIFSALASAKINIFLISQGASEINISYDCLTHLLFCCLELTRPMQLCREGRGRHSGNERCSYKGIADPDALGTGEQFY